MSAFDADFSALNEHERYKLLCALIVPRPIALVTTVNRDGKVNAAPFSFFQCICRRAGACRPRPLFPA
jgi:flavin reductase (DIM6/NTAB) family NADH-FMN oxidoreductase RutF